MKMKYVHVGPQKEGMGYEEFSGKPVGLCGEYETYHSSAFDRKVYLCSCGKWQGSFSTYMLDDLDGAMAEMKAAYHQHMEARDD